jgi:hypothetical protein
MQNDRFLVEADGRVLRVVRLVVQVEHVLHRRHELGAYLGKTPLLVLPWLELVLRKRARMVSGEMRSTKPSSTALPASRRSVQWSWPSGTGLQAMAMRCACCSPWRQAIRRWRQSLAQELHKRFQGEVPIHHLFKPHPELDIVHTHVHCEISIHLEKRYPSNIACPLIPVHKGMIEGDSDHIQCRLLDEIGPA